MTDDEFLALFRAASPKAQRQAIMIGLALLDFIQRKKALKRQRKQTQENASETTNAPAPAPLVVIPTPVESVEEKPLDTLEILPTDDDATKKRKLEETLRRRRRELGIKGYED